MSIQSSELWSWSETSPGKWSWFTSKPTAVVLLMCESDGTALPTTSEMTPSYTRQASVATGIMGDIVLVSIADSFVVRLLEGQASMSRGLTVIASLRSLLAKRLRCCGTSGHNINVASKVFDGPNSLMVQILLVVV